jgi:SAM-dependent methyltransferase
MHQPTFNHRSAPFDAVAARYDADFTERAIGRRKRAIVHRYLFPLLHADMDLLELNCGTGEDCCAVAGSVRSVVATDIASEMIAQTRRKAERRGVAIETGCMAIEELWSESPPALLREVDGSPRRFDMIVSNFDGINCLSDPSRLPAGIARHLRKDGDLLLVFMPPLCLLDAIAARIKGEGNPRRSGGEVHIGEGISMRTYFHDPRTVAALFSREGFELVAMRAVGLTTPPTRFRDFYERHPRLFRLLEPVENLLSRFPPFNRLGDHVLLHLKHRNSPQI